MFDLTGDTVVLPLSRSLSIPRLSFYPLIAHSDHFPLCLYNLSSIEKIKIKKQAAMHFN